MTIDPEFLANYIDLLASCHISDSGTIRCGANCHQCSFHSELDGSCEITNQADLYDMPYEQFETTIVHPLIAQTHPELLL